MRKRNKDRDGLYTRPNSPYFWASYTDAGGRRVRRSTGISKTRQGRKEAEALLAKWKLEAHKAEHWDKEPSRTFDELMLQFLKETMHRRRTGEYRVKVALRPLYEAFSGTDVTRLHSVDVRSYVRERCAKGLAASTVNKEVGLLSAAINYARREWGWDINNPAAGCRQKEPEGRVRWISRAEATALLRAAQLDPRAPHLTDFIQLALHTGCRRGELLELEWRRVDLHQNLLHLEAIHTKTERRRSIPINREAREALLNRARFRAAHCPASPWVFCNKQGARIQDVKTSFKTACQRAGIGDFRIHDMRHTCAAWLVSAGVSLIVVRDLLGHSTIKMTERYAHLAPDQVRSALDLLEATSSHSGHTKSDVLAEEGAK